MTKRTSRLSRRIVEYRRRGLSEATIAQYVHRKCGTSWNKAFPWTEFERHELERLSSVATERKEERNRRQMKRYFRVTQQYTVCRRAQNLGSSGLSMAMVRQLLDCTNAELHRWIEEKRLPPDGERFYYGVGPHGGSKWHPAWLSETIKSAYCQIDDWRTRDAENIRRYWLSETSLFLLVQGRYPDAVRQWSPNWLGRLAVDIYIPSINLAFEYQGVQHFKPVSAFGGDEGFQATQARDARKRSLLATHCVALIEWRFDTPIVATELDRALACLTEPPQK